MILPGALSRYVVEKGSITVDGVSLTVAALDDDGFDVAVIPHTLAVTTLGPKQPGDPVNLQVDVLANDVIAADDNVTVKPSGGDVPFPDGVSLLTPVGPLSVKVPGGFESLTVMSMLQQEFTERRTRLLEMPS